MTLSSAEQLLLELINRARLDPLAEAVRYGIDLNQGLAAGTLDAAPRRPLAPNLVLDLAADRHSTWMLDTNTFSHTGVDGSDSKQRMEAAGYRFTGDWRSGENISLRGESGGIDGDAAIRDGHHRDLFLSAGHRENLLYEDFREVGLGQIIGSYTSRGLTYDTSMVTENFATSGAAIFLTGVVYDDRDGDGFYSIGEGQGGVVALVEGAGQGVTAAAGGYGVAMAPGAAPVAVRIGDLTARVARDAGNVKLDLVDGDRLATSGSLSLDSAAASVTALGADAIDLTGHAGGDVLNGNRGANVLIGNGGGDILNGRGGDDLLIGDTLDVGLVQNEAGQVWRIYQAALGRTPDAAGHLGWTARLVAGSHSAEDVVSAFVASAEFATRFDTVAETGDFITLFYRNVLGRAPDPAGLAEWTRRLDSNEYTTAGALLAFSDSPENRDRVRNDVAATLEARTAAVWSDDVFRIYQATLGRTPDAAGFETWAGRMGAGQALSDLVSGFVTSAEFRSRYDNAADAAGFVGLLYDNVLGRAADATGLAGWTDRLDAQGWSRADVVLGFAQSVEFIRASAAPLEAWMRGLGVDDRLDGGGGNDRLVGGMFSDTFIFDARNDGHIRVSDLEAWDNLRFDSFGYDGVADVRAHLRASGADVVFADSGVTITLENTALADISDAMILV